MKRKKKEAWEKVFSDRFLNGEKKDNIYLTCLMYFLIFFMSFLLIFVCFVSMVEVDGYSMTDTLENTQHVLIYRNPQSVEREDIIVINAYDSDDDKAKTLIKRAIAVEGDKICFRLNSDGITVDLYFMNSDGSFVLKDESGYIKEPMKEASFHNKKILAKTDAEMETKTIEIGEDFVYFMGDNRNDSKDARNYGQQPTSQVTGKMFFKLNKGSILEYVLLKLYGAPSNSAIN